MKGAKEVATRVLLTFVIFYFYVDVWMWLEKMIDGCVTDRLVDDIMMLLFIPIIYISTGFLIKG